MSELGDKQRKFVYMVGKLIAYAYDDLGWELTFGDAYRDPRCPYGSSRSLHKDRLAIDFNLFVEGEWIDGKGTDDETRLEYALWERLGIFFENLGGVWGGRFATGPNAKDLNHFSLEFQGRR